MEITVKTLSELLADYEMSAEETKRELSQLKATMIVNFGTGKHAFPIVLDGTEKTAEQMFIKIIEYFTKPAGEKTHILKNG